jgi:alpha-galactosidase
LADARYRIGSARPGSLGPSWLSPNWLEQTAGLDSDAEVPSYSGSLLREAGLDLPTFHPDRPLVLRLARVDA